MDSDNSTRKEEIASLLPTVKIQMDAISRANFLRVCETLESSRPGLTQDMITALGPCPTKITALDILARMRDNLATPKTLRKMYLAREIFPPKLNINKFVVGAVAEEYFVRLLRTLGFKTENVAASETVIDIVVNDTSKYSIKTCSKVGVDIIIENYRGAKKDIPVFPPTFVIVLDKKDGTTILYIDDDVIRSSGYSGDMYRHSDSNLTLRGAFVKYLAETLPEDQRLYYDPVPGVDDIATEDISHILCDHIDRLCSADE
jgi:hypothetical protein